MDFNDWQERVDQWIKTYGVRYFDEMTNMLLLVEEVGELSRIMARHYGEQSFKCTDTPGDQEISSMIADEIADIYFVLTCIANQHNIRIEDILQSNLVKKTKRDNQRHQQNIKLSDQ